MITKTFDAKLDNLDEVLAFLETELENHDASMKVMMPISVCLEEMYVNVCHYAYEGISDMGYCKIDIDFENDDVIITLTDSGIPFDPVKKADPDISLSADERNIGGLGILMVKKTMDSIFYIRENDKNVFTMRKKIKNV